MTKAELAVRQAIIDQCRWMNDHGLNQGTSGNISVRHGDTMLLTPSATAYDTMEPEMIVAMPIRGRMDSGYGEWSGPLRPSSEWRFHVDILQERPEINAIVHTHSMFATTLSISRREIPAVHYMIAGFGGNTIRCAPYARYGTTELSDNALAALEDRTGCLLSNHGMIALGTTLPKAMWAAVELETLSKQYLYSLLLGGGVILPDDEIAGVKAKMGSYGLQEGPAKDVAKPAAKASAKRAKATAK
jgi:L-fuculose-phosphate aldolase